MDSLMISGLVAAVLLLSVVPCRLLSDLLVKRLNQDWRDSTLDYVAAAGATSELQQKITDLPVPPPAELPKMVIWLYGIVVAACSAAYPLLSGTMGTLEILATLLLAVLLLSALLVDLRIQLLPDMLMVPLGMVGLLLSLLGHSVSLETGIAAALGASAALWLIAQGFQLLRGQAGLGMGDVKLVAVAGLWLGYLPLPWLLMLASILAVVFYLLPTKVSDTRRIAFGPALAVAFLVMRLFAY